MTRTPFLPLVLIGLLIAVILQSSPPSTERAVLPDTIGTEHLVLRYSFDDLNATAVTDESGSGYAGIIAGPVPVTTGLADNAVAFDGVDDYVVLNSTQPVLPNQSTDFTLVAAVWPTATGRDQILIGNLWGGGGVGWVWLFYTRPSFYYGIAPNVSANVTIPTTSTELVFAPQTWNFAALSANRTHMAFYVNTARYEVALNATLGVGLPYNPTHALRLGHRQVGGPGYGFFGGQLDEVRIYNRTLSVLEIRQLHNILMSNSTAVCGNAVREDGEACDGPDFGPVTCDAYGYDAGTLVCDALCGSTQTHQCLQPRCTTAPRTASTRRLFPGALWILLPLLFLFKPLRPYLPLAVVVGLVGFATTLGPPDDDVAVLPTTEGGVVEPFSSGGGGGGGGGTGPRASVRTLSIGLMPNYNGNATSGQRNVSEFETSLDVTIDHAFYYAKMHQLNYTHLQRFLAQNETPTVVLEYFLPDRNEPVLADIAAGGWDLETQTFANFSRDCQQRMFVWPLAEFNSDWVPWGTYVPGNNKSDFVVAFRRVASILRTAPLTLQLTYARNNSNPTDPDLTQYYPGDSYVDEVLINGYNRAYIDESHQYWLTFDQVFGETYANLSRLTTKPLGIGETSTSSHNGDKPAWIRDAFNRTLCAYPRFTRLHWFFVEDPANPLKDWDLHDDADRAAFQAGMADVRQYNAGNRTMCDGAP